MIKRLTGTGLIVLMLLGFLQQAFADATGLNKVILQLRWDHQFQFAGYYAAQWKGFYQEQGFAVDIRSAITEDGRILSAPDEVAHGRADFGVGGADILLKYSQGEDLRVVAVIFQQSAARFYLNQTTSFVSLADLIDLRVARKVNDLIDVELQAMLLSEGIDPRKITPCPHQPGLDHLLSDMVQVIPGYKTTIPYYAMKRGLKLKEITPVTYGIDFYGDTLFTRGDLVSLNHDMVKRFSRASIKGWEYAMTHPQEIADKISTRLKRIKPVEDTHEFNRFQAEVIKELTLYPIIELGHTNPFRWEKMYKFLKLMGLVQRELKLDTFIFNPEKIRDARERKIQSVLQWGSILIIAVSSLIFIWAYLLKRLVNRRTSELQTAVAELKQANKELEQFAYVSSHDLQEPLRMVSGYVQLLKRRYNGKLDEDADEFISFAVEGAARMQAIINDLLILYGLGTGEKLFESVKTGDIINQALTGLQKPVRDTGTDINYGQLPSVMADASQLELLFRHLISNAIKFKKEQPPRIHIAAERKDNEWIFSVRDNGIGIASEYHDRIFVIFQRLHHRSQYSGNGIGLAICRKIVNRHGGHIWLESEPEKGTVFYFSIPDKPSIA